MTKISFEYQIQTLKQFVKMIIRKGYGCQGFYTTHHPKPCQGLIFIDRTSQDLRFKIIRANCSGPFIFKNKGKRDTRTYLLLMKRKLTRAVHLRGFAESDCTRVYLSNQTFICKKGKATVPIFRQCQNSCFSLKVEQTNLLEISHHHVFQLRLF